MLPFASMAASLHPPHFDPSIRHSSKNSSVAASSQSFPLDSNTDVTSLDHFIPSPARNSHSIEDRDMKPQEWQSLASTLGIQAFDTPRSNPEAQKLARKLSKKRNIADKQLSELLLPIITSVSNEHPRLLLTLSTTFNRDAVPLDHPSFIFGKTRLPTPRPAMTMGYNPQIFHPHYRELMQGIISDPTGQPRNLDKISQACQGTYWPFFAVEISNDDRDANYQSGFARASAVSATATCNNALLTLASTLDDVSNPVQHDTAFREILTKSISSFSLAISSTHKTAVLLAHTTSFENPYCTAEDIISSIYTYNLSSPADTELLAARLKSIFAWAETTRLLKIMDLLDRFDARVQFRETKLSQEADLCGPMDMMQRGQLAPKLLPGQVQMSGGMGRGISVPIPESTMTVHSVLSSSTVSGVSAATPGLRGRSVNRKSPVAAVLSHRDGGGSAHNGSSPHSGSGSATGTAGATSGKKYMPDTPKTPESMKLTLNPAAAVGEDGGKVGKAKKTSLFKTVLNDAMPSWSKVEM